MKRTEMNQIRLWCGMLLAGLLLVGFAPTASLGLFTDAFATGNWTVAQYGDNPGGYAFTGTGSTAVLVLTASAAGPSDTVLSLNSPYASTEESVFFNWTLSDNGNIGTPQAYFFVGGTEYDLIGTKGSLTVEVPADTKLSFELVGDVSPGKGAAQLDITAVPEAGTALTGVLVLGAAGFEWFRRKRTAGS